MNAGHTLSNSWQSDEIGLNNPFSKCERMIIVHAGSNDGFIPGAKRCVQAGSSFGDDHEEMNFEKFKNWSENRLVPNLKPKSVLDNTAYHNVQQDKCQTKADIQAYLQRHNVPFGEKMFKAVCRRNKRPRVHRR